MQHERWFRADFLSLPNAGCSARAHRGTKSARPLGRRDETVLRITGTPAKSLCGGLANGWRVDVVASSARPGVS